MHIFLFLILNALDGSCPNSETKSTTPTDMQSLHAESLHYGHWDQLQYIMTMLMVHISVHVFLFAEETMYTHSTKPTQTPSYLVSNYGS